MTRRSTTYPDGVVSNILFNAEAEAAPVWRYPDLAAHVAYLSRVIARTVSEQMREQSRYLRRHARARAALKEIVEMPDHQADRVLRSIEQNNGELSNVLAREMPVLARMGVWAEAVEAVARVWSQDEVEFEVISRYRTGGRIDG